MPVRKCRRQRCWVRCQWSAFDSIMNLAELKNQPSENIWNEVTTDTAWFRLAVVPEHRPALKDGARPSQRDGCGRLPHSSLLPLLGDALWHPALSLSIGHNCRQKQPWVLILLNHKMSCSPKLHVSVSIKNLKGPSTWLCFQLSNK